MKRINAGSLALWFYFLAIGVGIIRFNRETLAQTPFGTPVADTLFTRGDSNVDGIYTIADALYILVELFWSKGPPPPCSDATDVNDNGNYTIGDALYIVVDLFGGGPSPPPPWPDCGVDPTNDTRDCENYPPCNP